MHHSGLRGHLHAGVPAPCARRRHHHPEAERPARQLWRTIAIEDQSPVAAMRRAQEQVPRKAGADAGQPPDTTFSCGENARVAGANTFLKAPSVGTIRNIGQYDAAIVGVPFDGGARYRLGARFGPQGIRRISGLYPPYHFESGVDLREQMTLCDAGDLVATPGNAATCFDQISRGVSQVFSSGAMPVILGGDHSIGDPALRGIADCTSKRIGIIRFDRHIDRQGSDQGAKAHKTPCLQTTKLHDIASGSHILTIDDIERIGPVKAAEMTLAQAWDGADAVYLSFDIGCVDGGFLPREALNLVGMVAAGGLCGMEVVEVAPAYDCSDIASLLATRVVVAALGAMVGNKTMGAHLAIIDKPVRL